MKVIFAMWIIDYLVYKENTVFRVFWLQVCGSYPLYSVVFHFLHPAENFFCIEFVINLMWSQFLFLCFIWLSYCYKREKIVFFHLYIDELTEDLLSQFGSFPSSVVFGTFAGWWCLADISRTSKIFLELVYFKFHMRTIFFQNNLL